MEHCRRNFKTVVPLPAVNQAMTVCKILEGILPKVHGFVVTVLPPKAFTTELNMSYRGGMEAASPFS